MTSDERIDLDEFKNELRLRGIEREEERLRRERQSREAEEQKRNIDRGRGGFSR